MKPLAESALASLAATTVVLSTLAFGDGRTSIPSAVVTVQNQTAQRSGFQTPVWAGIHDSSLAAYDRDVALGDTAANPNLRSRESVKRAAEDGITGPTTDELAVLQAGTHVSTKLNAADTFLDHYFSYASMVIPSSDAFVANGNSIAHEIFDDHGRVVVQDFIVSDAEVLDAGNDQIAGNSAFSNQADPNIGAEKNEVITPSSGFAAPSSLTYPDRVLNHPAFSNAQFTEEDARALQFHFRHLDLGRTVRLRASLSPEQEVAPELVDSRASGSARLISRNGERVSVAASFRGLSSRPSMAHLHLGQAGVNGPVVVDLAGGLGSSTLHLTVDARDVVGPLADAEDPFRALLNELAAGNIYLNVQTPENPAGEIRGQVSLR